MLGVLAAATLSSLYFLQALWRPARGLPVGILFLIAAWGIQKRRYWSAAGGAGLSLVLTLVWIVESAAPEAWLDGLPIAVLHLATGWLMFSAISGASILSRAEAAFWWIVLSGVLVIGCFARVDVHSGDGMSPELHRGDRLLMLEPNLEPRQTFARGTLVVTNRAEPGLHVGRIIAVGGDRIRIDAGRVFLNGQQLQEPYAVASSGLEVRDFFPGDPNLADQEIPAEWASRLQQDLIENQTVVPRGKYFLLGDNRANAIDSRYLGFVDATEIAGEPLVVLYSSEATEDDLMPALLTLRWDRLFKPLP